jgi:hypothetical protein
MTKPDFDLIDRALGEALESIPIKIEGDRNLWYLRFELRRLQLLTRRMNLVKNRAKEIAKELGVRSKRPNSK